MAKFLTTPVPHTEGAAFIEGKPAVTRRVFDQLAPELQARAFLITGIEALDVVARVRELTAQLPVGGDFKDLRGRILNELSPWLVTSTDPDERAKQESAAYRRAELLLRLHGWQAYARTQHALMEEHIDVFPFRKYLSSEDNRVRPTHAALDKKILPANHPFWQNHTPPWEFNCRCDCVPMTAEEVGDIAAAETLKPDEDKLVVPPSQLREIEQNKRLVKPGAQGFFDLRTPRERTGEGYEWRPADDALSIDQILARFSPGERQAFEDFAARQRLEDGRTLLDWWKNGPAPTPAPAPAAPRPAAGPIVAVIPPAAPAPKPKAKKAPAAKLPTDPVDRMRARIAGANYKTDTPLGGGINTTVKVKNGVQVVFKPASGEYGQTLRAGILPGEQYKREKAASLIDQHLGIHLVPPTEIITRHGEIGSAQLFRPGFQTVHKLRTKGIRPNVSPEDERKRQLLDDVLGHVDRHGGNWMLKRTKGSPFMEVALIDNGLSLASEPYGSGTRFPGPLHGKPLDPASERQLDDFVARRAEWEPEVLSLIGQDAVNLLFQRINTLKKSGFGIAAPQFSHNFP